MRAAMVRMAGARLVAAQRRGVGGSPTGERRAQSAAVLLPFYEEGSLFHFHGSSTARRAAGSRSSSVSASEAAPMPVAAVPVVALLCRSQLSSTPHARRFYTSSRHDGADTRLILMPARVHARTHAYAHGRRVIPAATRHARGTAPTRT